VPNALREKPPVTITIMMVVLLLLVMLPFKVGRCIGSSDSYLELIPPEARRPPTERGRPDL
jgi:hypothetical protein